MTRGIRLPHCLHLAVRSQQLLLHRWLGRQQLGAHPPPHERFRPCRRTCWLFVSARKCREPFTSAESIDHGIDRSIGWRIDGGSIDASKS